MVQLCPLIFAAIVPAKHTPIQAEGLKEQVGQECFENTHCVDDPRKPVCDMWADNPVCVECTDSEHCKDKAPVCHSNKCVETKDYCNDKARYYNFLAWCSNDSGSNIAELCKDKCIEAGEAARLAMKAESETMKAESENQQRKLIEGRQNDKNRLAELKAKIDGPTAEPAQTEDWENNLESGDLERLFKEEKEVDCTFKKKKFCYGECNTKDGKTCTEGLTGCKCTPKDNLTASEKVDKSQARKIAKRAAGPQVERINISNIKAVQ